MKRIIIIFWSICLIACPLTAHAGADYPQTYKFYMELGKLALDQSDYLEAYNSFRRAQLIAPHEREPAIFINLIIRLQSDRIEPKPATRVFRPFKRSRVEIIEDALDQYSAHATPEERVREPAVLPPQRVPREPRRTSGPVTLPPVHIAVEPPPQVTTPRTAIASKTPKYILPPDSYPEEELQGIVYLNDELWQDQPGTLIRVELRKSTILETSNYKRHLIITPGFIEIEQLDKDQIMIVAKKRGSTFLHVWDDTGRWTFKVEVILPLRKTLAELLEHKSETGAEPFKLTYAADWSAFYTGHTLDEVERENLNFLQRALIEGETPYGDFDSHAIFNKFEESTEVTGYGVGLTDGRIGDFKDFSIRGYDIQKTFSPLSLPGQYVRGVLFESEAFHNQLKYTYMRGRDRQVFGFLTPDAREERESFVEAARVTLFPHEENQYSLNFAHGYGDAREPYLNDQVFSVEAQHRISPNVFLKGELAYDETSTAATVSTKYEGDHHQLTVNARDIESAFTTATSLPGNRGEAGGTIFWDWRLGDININTFLDLYRDRFLPNPEAEDAVNVDFNSTIEIPIADKDRLRTSFYYVDTTGELSPRNNVRSNIVYTKYFQFGDKRITTFAGLGQQRSRYARSSASEYDRYSASAGMTAPLIKNLNYYVNYERSWLYEEQSGNHLSPNVMNTGLNYSRKLFDHWSLHSSFSYRNEENTNGNNSFLAGEDSITGSLGTSYRPNDDLEFFIDGRTRNVWAEEETRPSYNEIDVRAGVRTAWGLPFVWNPKGKIIGFVYKDLNGNQRQDGGEPGIPDVAVEIGTKRVVTDASGYFAATVRAKAAEVKVDITTIPAGFIFSTPSIVNVEIIPHKTEGVAFGLTTQSGIYGIVFYDQNKSGKPDDGDEFIGQVKFTLDGTESTLSDFEGTYSFDMVEPGTHQLAIDVNSIPIDYIPKAKIKNTITVSEGATFVFHIPLEKVERK